MGEPPKDLGVGNLADATTATELVLARTETGSFSPAEVTESDWQKILDPNLLRSLGPENADFVARIRVLSPERFEQIDPPRIRVLASSSYLSGVDSRDTSIRDVAAELRVLAKRIDRLGRPLSEDPKATENVLGQSRIAAARAIAGKDGEFSYELKTAVLGRAKELLLPDGNAFKRYPTAADAWELQANLRITIPAEKLSLPSFYQTQLREELEKLRALGPWSEFVRLTASAAICGAKEVRIIPKRGIEISPLATTTR